MKNLVDHLSNYAEYHRDSRNIMTHMVGIPMIVFSVIVLLSRPVWDLGGVIVTPAVVVCFLSSMFYLYLNKVFGVIMAIKLSTGIYFANKIATESFVIWLSIGLLLFFIGWIIQFIGHYYEGKKPAFMDDLTGLIIGPLFVLAEGLFAFGMYKELKNKIELNAGKVKHKKK